MRSGRCYLVGYDVAPRKGWRRFALDAIRPPLRRAGSFRPRPVPSHLVSADAIGLFDGGTEVAVTVELSPSVAAAATCRLWQERQRVVELPGGGVHLTFSVRDQAEVVRWAFGFGAEARVIAPASAVALARTMLTDLQAVYATDAGPRRATRSA